MMTDLPRLTKAQIFEVPRMGETTVSRMPRGNGAFGKDGVGGFVKRAGGVGPVGPDGSKTRRAQSKL